MRSKDHPELGENIAAGTNIPLPYLRPRSRPAVRETRVDYIKIVGLDALVSFTDMGVEW